MDYFAVDGTWWLPASPSRRCIGTLALESESFNLTLDGSIEPDSDPSVPFSMPEWKSTQVIHGRQRTGEDVTLLHAEGANFTGPRASESSYRIRFALIGCHELDDRFVAARVEFDCLNEWTQPPPLTDMTSEDMDFVVHFGTAELGSSAPRNAFIRLLAEGQGTISGQSAKVERRVVFAVDFEAAPVSAILDRWVRPLQDLLVLSTGHPIRLTSVHLRRPDSDYYTRLVFEAVQPAASRASTWSSVHGYSAPTLLTFRTCPLPEGQGLPADVAGRHRDGALAGPRLGRWRRPRSRRRARPWRSRPPRSRRRPTVSSTGCSLGRQV